MTGPIGRAAFATGLVGIAWLAAFAGLTRGFTALTSETARRDSVAESPIAVPALLGTDQTGRSHELFADLDGAGHGPRVTIVGFIYTRCVTVCGILGGSYQQLQAEILERHLAGRVRLVTVSFDPSNDTPEALAGYARRMHADPTVWTLMRPQHTEQIPGLLASFGVVVVPAPMEQFQHNAGFHVLDFNGRLARIVDLTDPLGALDVAISLGSTSPSPI
jgi:protein SCO1/2